MIDVAPVEVLAAGKVVEFVAKIPVLVDEEEMQDKWDEQGRTVRLFHCLGIFG